MLTAIEDEFFFGEVAVSGRFNFLGDDAPESMFLRDGELNILFYLINRCASLK